MSSITNHIDLFQRVLNCDACVKAGDCKVLRDDRQNLPQPGYIGGNFNQQRVVILAQNPGVANAGQPYYTVEVEHAKRLQHLKAQPEQASVDSLNDLLGRFIPEWTIYKHCLGPILAQGGLSMADVAYFNLARCRTQSNAALSQTMKTNCMQLHLIPWLKALQPRVVICIGKEVHRTVAPTLQTLGIQVDYINRQRSLSSEARMQDRARIGALLRGQPA